LDRTQGPAFHYELGQELRPLRRKGVLIVGSGNAVHNLGLVAWQDVAYDWALEFDDKIKQLIQSGDHRAMVRYDRLGRAAQRAGQLLCRQGDDGLDIDAVSQDRVTRLGLSAWQ
jgi:4,5-DOPA dioxygenase extradiol